MPIAQETARVSPSLFDQVKGIAIDRGQRRKPADVFFVINNRLEGQGKRRASQEQIQTVLEAIPEVFPEDWRRPWARSLARYAHRDLRVEQRLVFEKIQSLGPHGITGQQLEMIIREGVYFRDHCQRIGLCANQ